MVIEDENILSKGSQTGMNRIPAAVYAQASDFGACKHMLSKDRAKALSISSSEYQGSC